MGGGEEVYKSKKNH